MSRVGPSRTHGAVTRARARWTAFGHAHPGMAGALPGLVLIAVGLLGFAVLFDSVQEQDDLMLIDEPVLTWLVQQRGPVGTAILYTVTLISGPVVLPILVGTAAVIWGVRSRDWWRPLLLLGSMVVSTLISLVIKQGVARPRPPEETMFIPGAETTYSFPSGHTIGTATLCLVGGYLFWSRRPSARGLLWWALVTVAATGAVGLSRLYLGYHFVTDVLAAVCLAVAVLGTVVLVDERHLRRLRSAARAGPS